METWSTDQKKSVFSHREAGLFMGVTRATIKNHWASYSLPDRVSVSNLLHIAALLEHTPHTEKGV